MAGYKLKRRIIQVLMTILIIGLPFFDIVRIDVPTRRFYFFNSVLWVDEIYLIFLVVILFSLILLYSTLIYGRLFCGWACPQTIISDFARWLDKAISKKFKRKGPAVSLSWIIKSVVLLFISFLISINIVIYFIDPYRLFGEISTWSQGPVVNGIIIGLTVLVFLNLLFVREIFCIKACPYGLLQALFTDSMTQIVKYDSDRSDDCIKGNHCIKSCVMEIDIRNTPYHTNCNYCGDCIDACTAAMKKKNLPPIIHFSQGEHPVQGGFLKRTGILTGKRLMFLLLISILTVGVVYKISVRSPLSINVIQDRYTLIREGEDGLYYNDYQMKITNRSLEDGTFRFNCINQSNGEVMKVQKSIEEIFLKSRETGPIQFSIASDGKGLKPGPNKIDCTAFRIDKENIKTKAEIIFFMPEKNVTNRSN